VSIAGHWCISRVVIPTFVLGVSLCNFQQGFFQFFNVGVSTLLWDCWNLDGSTGILDFMFLMGSLMCLESPVLDL
jgi:hypothetical protein